MPIIGELIFMSFHVTCVYESDVPRSETVESVARPYSLTQIEEPNFRAPAICGAMLSCSTQAMISASCVPILFIGRVPTMSISLIPIVPPSTNKKAYFIFINFMKIQAIIVILSHYAYPKVLNIKLPNFRLRKRAQN